jgi:hypothetical protein
MTARVFQNEGNTRGHRPRLQLIRLMERTEWSSTRKHLGLATTPVCGANEATRHFIDAAATPPVSGGEFLASDSRLHC